MRDAKDVVPYDVVGCCHQKATRYFEKSGLANKECVVSALSVSLTTATSPRVRGRFDEKNASKDHIVKHGVPANPDLWGEEQQYLVRASVYNTLAKLFVLVATKGRGTACGGRVIL